MKRRIGIVGFGKLGQHLFSGISLDADHEVAFVYNRTRAALVGVPDELVLDDLERAQSRSPDLIVEVAHPSITHTYGEQWISFADYLVGSPTALAKDGVDEAMVAAATKHGLYVPRGALPALEEVLRLAARNAIGAAHITMRKHPRSLKLTDEVLTDETMGTLYDGPLRPLCAKAPNNVNTMAVLAMASGLGFDAVRATLVADPTLQHHITEVDLQGPMVDGPRFRLELRRSSPAGVGAVTSTATLSNFLTSVLAANRGSGVHYC